MKPRRLPISSHANRNLAGSSIVLAFSLLTTSAFATPYTWNNTGTDFATGSNWGGTAPADSLTLDTAIFAAATTAIPSLAADRSILGMDFTASAGGATLTSAAGVILTLGATGIDATTQFDGANTVSVANLKLGAAQTWTLFGSTTSIATTSTFGVSSNIDLNGQNLTVNPNRNGTGGSGTVNLSGNITGAAGANGLFFSGGGAFRNTLNLTGANTYTGKTTISNLTLTANSLADSGTSALGFGDLTLGANGTSAGVVLTFQSLAADSTTSRLVTTSSIASSGVAINNSDGENTVAFTNAGNLDTHAGSASNLNFTLGGSNTGNNTFGQVINERAGTGVTNFTKSGTGTWVLSNAGNSFAGAMTLSSTTTSAGILAYASADGANSINFSQTTGSATLSYTGASAKTMNGLISAAALSTGAITLDASGVTSADAVNYSNPGSLGTSGTSGAKNLTLSGTNAGTNTLAGRWENNTAGGAATLTKSGNGTWVLLGTNTYTGKTTLTAGTLSVGTIGNGGVAGNLGQATNAVANLVFNGGTLQYTGATATSDRAFTINAGKTATIDTTNDLTLAGATGAATTGALTKTGVGTLTLSGTSTYTGATTVNAGKLQAGSTAAFGTNSAVTLADVAGASLDLNGFNNTVGSLAGGGASGGNITLGGGTLSVGGLNTPTSYGGSISGTGGFTKTGSGTLTLSGTNTYSGGTVINGGVVAIGAANQLGTATSNYLTFTGNGSLRSTAAMVLPSTGTITVNTGIMASIGNQSATATTFEIAGKITGSGSVMRSSPAITGSIVRFSNDANDYTGDFKAGNQFTEFTSVANAGVASALGAGSTAYATSFGANNSGSILRYVGFGNSSTNRAIDWQSTTAYLNVSNTGSGSVQYLASGTLKSLSGSAGFSLDGTNTGANVFAQVINDNGGITTLTKSGAGTWSVMGTNTYTGVTTLSAGTLGVGSIGNGGVAGNLGQATNAAGNLVFNGGTLLYTGASATSDRAFTINAGKTAVINTTHHLTLAGATGTGTNGALTKLGAGTLTLTGANTYTGATLISGGTLALGASGTIDDTSEVSLGTVGTFDVSAKSLGYTVATLKGSGNVTGALTVSTQLAIGNSPGTTHFSGNLTLDSATYVYELTSGASPGVGSADLGNVAGDLTIIGGSILDLVELGTYTAGNKFTLFGYGTLSGTFDGLADGATFTDAGGIWMIDYDDGTAGANGGTGTGFVTITAVPEPNAASLLGGLGILALMRRRR